MAAERTTASEVGMEREIKFRLFWDGKFIYWGFNDEGDGLTFASPSFGGGLSIKESLERSQQFTGLKDCKRTKEFPEGQEIYEGSIVNVEHYIYPGQDREEVTHKDLAADVIWCDRQAIFEIRTTECRETSYPEPYIFNAGPMRIEVIGNIDENPKLLEKTNGT